MSVILFILHFDVTTAATASFSHLDRGVLRRFASNQWLRLMLLHRRGRFEDGCA